MRIISILLSVMLLFSLCGCRKVKVGADVSSSVQTSGEKTSSKVDPDKCKHKFSAVSMAATCTTDGRLVKSCSICGFSEEKVIKAQGHIMILGKCGNCDYVDTVDNVKTVVEWINTNSNGKYVLNDKRYYIRTIGQELLFCFKDEECSLFISVHGKEDNMCYIEYLKSESIEGAFPMEWVHSSNYRNFEKMSGPNDSELKSRMVEELVSKIDTILKTFDDAMKEKVDISITSIGFTSY